MRARTDYGRWSKEKVAEAISLYNNGSSLRQIAIKLGGKPTTLRGYLAEEGIEIRSRGYYRTGAKNNFWAGSSVSYTALHTYVRKHKPMPETCENCMENKRLEVANISGTYLRDLSDWKWLCHGCHMKMDRLAGRYMAADAAMRLASVMCPVCKRLFHPRSSKQVYCTRSHAARAVWSKRPSKTPNKVCPQCRTPFYHRKPQVVYCNRDCYKISRQKLSTSVLE